MAHDLDSALAGISGILVTPYDAGGEIAPERLAPILDRALGAGLHMPVVNGNTGEFYALTTDEACTMVREVAGLIGRPRAAARGRRPRHPRRLPARPRLGRCGRRRPDGRTSRPIPWSRRAAPSTTSRPSATPRAACRSRSTSAMTLSAPEASSTSARFPDVKGVKWATPNPMRLADAMHAATRRSPGSAGLAEVWAPTFYAVGARGFTAD